MNNTRNKYVYLSCPLKYKVKQVIYVFSNLNKVWAELVLEKFKQFRQL